MYNNFNMFLSYNNFNQIFFKELIFQKMFTFCVDLQKILRKAHFFMPCAVLWLENVEGVIITSYSDIHACPTKERDSLNQCT